MNLDYVSIGEILPKRSTRSSKFPSAAALKYEMDKKAEHRRPASLYADAYPGNYGFIPHTLRGRRPDVLVANTRPIVPGAIVAVRPIGVLKMMDEERRRKIIACRFRN
jgi:inorganic pyrophosphatase